MEELYIYKYVYNGEVIYIGKTNSSLKNRINSHSKEAKFKKYNTAQVYCFQCKNRIETDIYEKYLINKYKPILNVADKLPQKLDIIISEKEWVKYEEYTPIKKSVEKKQSTSLTRNVYPAFFTKTKDNVLVEIPDFEILTEGKDMYEAINNARDAANLKCVSLEDDKKEVPIPSDINILNLADGIFYKEGESFVSLINIDSKDYRRKIDTKTVRRNVALPSWLNYAADQAGINVSRILQEALMKTLKVENRM